MDNAIPGMADRPWGATRLGPYPTTVKMPFTAVGIDPATQLGVFRDASGRIVKMDEDRTRQSTSNPTSAMTSTYNSTSTAMVDSSDSDSDSDSDSNSDMDSDEYRDI
ncbi:putative ATP-grasp-modified RiPP [Streptomyces sp. NPDC004685]